MPELESDHIFPTCEYCEMADETVKTRKHPNLDEPTRLCDDCWKDVQMG